MAHGRFGTNKTSIRRRRDDKATTYLLDTFVKAYIVLILFENSVIHSEPFGSLFIAKERAVSLANEWYRKDGIEAFGKYQLEPFDEIQAYYRSDAYLDSGDGVHIVIESL